LRKGNRVGYLVPTPATGMQEKKGDFIKNLYLAGQKLTDCCFF
jgi:hypothetical protein